MSVKLDPGLREPIRFVLCRDGQQLPVRGGTLQLTGALAAEELARLERTGR